MATLVLLLVPGVMAGVLPDAPSLLDQVGDPTPLGEHYRDYELQVMDPYEYRAKLATGSIDVTLQGRAFRVLVEPAPWDARLGTATPRADGGWDHHYGDFENVVYLGRVERGEASHALFVVTGSGVYGYVTSGPDTLYFDPVRFYLPLAPVGVSVVFHGDDRIVAPDPAHERSTAHVPSEGGMPPTSEMGIAHHAGGPNRAIALFADAEGRVTDYNNRILNIISTVNAHYGRLVGFQFNVVNNVVYSCDAECPNGDALLQTWADWVSRGGAWNGYEVAHLFTGKQFADHVGRAYQPGRYGYSVFGGNDVSTAHTVAHELGHNFNARHARGFSYPHTHTDGSQHQHSTLMASGAGTQWEFSSANNNWVRACNAHSYSAGTYTPGSAGNFGDRCWTTLVNHQNGGNTWPNFDATDFRGKYFSFMTRGTVDRVCVHTNAAGSFAFAARPTPQTSTPLFTVWIDATGPGRFCAAGDYTWRHDSMFIYKTFGTGAVGWDTNTPTDGFRSDDEGASFYQDNTRLGIEVSIQRDNLPVDACGVLASNSQINPDGYIRSCNLKHQLVYQLDGNVVLYNSTGTTKVDWATHTPGTSTNRFAMQGDGNLVLYDGAGTAIWASNTAGNPGAWLSLRDDGILVILATDGRTLWMEGCGLLGPNSRILRGYEIRSCSREYALAHQTDGNVVLYRNGQYDNWATDTGGWYGTTELKMQDDGNLVLYSPPYVAWASDSPGNPNSVLRLTDDGRLFIQTPYGDAICHKMRC